MSQPNSIFNHMADRSSHSLNHRPATDIIENKNDFKIFMDIPGMEKNSIEIKLEQNKLLVKGTPTPNKSQNALYTEYQPGTFQQTLEIPDKVDQNQIKAQLDNGVLTLTLPKSAQKAGRVISVH